MIAAIRAAAQPTVAADNNAVYHIILILYSVRFPRAYTHTRTSLSSFANNDSVYRTHKSQSHLDEEETKQDTVKTCDTVHGQGVVVVSVVAQYDTTAVGHRRRQDARARIRRFRREGLRRARLPFSFSTIPVDGASRSRYDESAVFRLFRAGAAKKPRRRVVALEGAATHDKTTPSAP